MKTAERMVAKWFVLVINMKGTASLIYATAAGLGTVGKMVSSLTPLYHDLDTRISNM